MYYYYKTSSKFILIHSMRNLTTILIVSISALTRMGRRQKWHLVCKQGVAITGRNRTGPPCSVGRPTTRPAAGPPAGNITATDDDDRRQTTDAREQNNTGPLVTKCSTIAQRECYVPSHTHVTLTPQLKAHSHSCE